jgi:hypothetical protein
MQGWMRQVCLILLIAVLLAIDLPRPNSTFAAMARQPAPMPTVKTALYRHAGTRWVASSRLHEGDRLLLVVRYRWNPEPYVNNRGWYTPSANLVIRRDIYPYTESHPRVGYQGVLFISPWMHRTALPNGFKRFHLEIDLPRHARRWIGKLEFEVQVTNGSGGYYGIRVSPTPTVSAH